jgi:hypothetical protein
MTADGRWRTADGFPAWCRAAICPLLAALCWSAAAAADPWDALAAASQKPAAEAKAAIEQILLANPGFHAARFNLGTLLLDGDPAKAAEQFELALAAPASELTAAAWYNLALARFKQGRLEEALIAAEKAVGLDPSAAGLRDELRRVVLVRQDEARRKAEEEAKKLHLNPVPLPPARVGEAYSAKLPIAGGTPPATASLGKDGKLPDGLNLATDGTISGTPRSAGDATLPIALRDAAGGEANGSVVLHVLPAPAITTATLPEAIIGQPYQAKLAAVGLDRPVRWTVAGLPEGLTASDDGAISGTPTKTGISTLHCHAADATRAANRMLDLAVSDAFAPAENPLPAATATARYQYRATVRGPTQEYRWSGLDGAALAIAADGTLNGTPEKAGDLTVKTRIAAADGRSRVCDLLVPVNPPPLIQPEPIQLTVGAPVDQALKLEGGTAPFAWSAAGGTLPTGIRLDPDGHLRGVAKDPGSSTITVAVVDRWKAGTQAELTITVKPAENPPPQDQAKQDQDKDQQQGQQQSKDQQGQGKDQQAGKDKDQQAGKDGEKPEAQPGDDQQAQTGAGQPQDDPAAQAAAINQTAADRWLDQLPDEDRGVLRYQLLEGGERKPDSKGKPW